MKIKKLLNGWYNLYDGGSASLELTDKPLTLTNARTFVLQEMNAPSFRVEKNCDGCMLLHYYSDRSGLCHIVPGETNSYL